MAFCHSIGVISSTVAPASKSAAIIAPNAYAIVITVFLFCTYTADSNTTFSALIVSLIARTLFCPSASLSNTFLPVNLVSPQATGLPCSYKHHAKELVDTSIPNNVSTFLLSFSNPIHELYHGYHRSEVCQAAVALYSSACLASRAISARIIPRQSCDSTCTA